jgi:hypothetical protein
MRIGEWEKRGTAESIPRFTLRNRLVLFRHESSSRGLELRAAAKLARAKMGRFPA